MHINTNLHKPIDTLYTHKFAFIHTHTLYPSIHPPVSPGAGGKDPKPPGTAVEEEIEASVK